MLLPHLRKNQKVLRRHQSQEVRAYVIQETTKRISTSTALATSEINV